METKTSEKKNLRLSKSSVGTYLTCPYGYKLSYIDKIVTPANIYLLRGIDVHSFHDKFFDNVSCDGSTLKIGELDFKESCDIDKKELAIRLDYKKNIVKHYSKKWEQCVAKKGERAFEYFKPFDKEKKIVIENKIEGVDIVGIPDAIEKDFDDNLVVCEVKTGKPNAAKCVAYKNDLIFYKLLGEHKYGVEINRGKIYFPYSNYEYVHERLTPVEVIHLLNQINDVAVNIREQKFEPVSQIEACKWCAYQQEICPYAVK
jgi:hypothetical protein